MMKTETARSSLIASYIDGLLTEKRSNGYSYECEEQVLNRFDAYCSEHHLDTVKITKDFLSGWMEKSDTEGAFNQSKRICCVRQLLLFMATSGVDVYIPHDFCHTKKALPHIFAQQEITSFFEVVDSYPVKGDTALSHNRLEHEYRIVFRWYLCCGLRNSEAVGIRTENVNLATGILTILNSKGHKDRLVYLPQDLLESTRKYYAYLTTILGYEPEWFFPGLHPEKPLTNTTIDSVFRRYWRKTPYANCSNRPTVHDFRFSFVVSRMNNWAENGFDLQVMMPYLSKYLGHKSINETLYYYYLVEEAFRTVKKKDSISNDVIPEVTSYE